jgi:hypothetical protein
MIDYKQFYTRVGLHFSISHFVSNLKCKELRSGVHLFSELIVCDFSFTIGFRFLTVL